MRKEDRLIKLFCRLSLGIDEGSKVKNLANDSLDWDYIFKKSSQEGVCGLIYSHINNSGFKPPQTERFRGEYRSNTLKSTPMIYALKKIAQALSSQDIKAIVLKGFLSSDKFYQDIFIRPSCDIDLLIQKKDLPRVNSILSSLGYSALQDYQTNLTSGLSANNSLLYSNNSRNVCVHLHWHLVNSSWPLESLVKDIDMERVWSQAEKEKLEDFTSGHYQMSIRLCILLYMD